VPSDFSRLVGAFWEICLLRRSPEDVPASRFLFNGVVSTYCLLGVGINLVGFDFPEACVLSVSMTALLLTTLKALLLIRGNAERLRQSAIALMGASIILFVPALVLRLWFHIIESSNAQSNAAGYVWVGLFVWELFISAHILRHALNTRLLAGFFVSIAYVFLEFRLMSFIHQSFATTPGTG
jgi:hypothetical protein